MMFSFREYCQLIHDLPAQKNDRLQKVAADIRKDTRLTRWQQALLLEQVFMKLEPHLRH
ncbi:MAG TPA: hypothetical protein VF171_03890 [Trueperaceae bacterium]